MSLSNYKKKVSHNIFQEQENMRLKWLFLLYNALCLCSFALAYFILVYGATSKL